MQLSKREKFLLALLGLVLVFVVCTAYVIMPLLESIRKSQDELSGLQIQELQVRDAISQKDQLDAAVAQARDAAKKESDAFLPPMNAWDLERYFLAYCDREGVVCTSVGVPSYTQTQITAYAGAAGAAAYPAEELADSINRGQTSAPAQGTAADAGNTGGAAGDGTGSAAAASDTLLKTTVTFQCSGDMLSVAGLLRELSDDGHLVGISSVTMNPAAENALGWELPVSAQITLDIYSVETID